MSLATKKPGPKKCRNPACRAMFTPAKPLQAACGIPCALALTVITRAKASAVAARQERAERKAARERIKPKAEHMKEAQAAFNEFIRERDRDLPCVSCGRHHEGQYHAGHYRTVGANPELRFEPLNVHKQCAPCNNHKSGDIVNYRIKLARRIHPDQIEWLEGKHEPKRYTIEQLKAIKAHYRALVRQMKKDAA